MTQQNVLPTFDLQLKFNAQLISFAGICFQRRNNQAITNKMTTVTQTFTGSKSNKKWKFIEIRFLDVDFLTQFASSTIGHRFKNLLNRWQTIDVANWTTYKDVLENVSYE